MPKVDLDSIEQTNTHRLSAAVQRTCRGALVAPVGAGRPASPTSAPATSMLEPGAWSSQRHWHEARTNSLVMLDGEAVLVEDDGETELAAGDIAAWPKGVTNGHHLINRSDGRARFVAISGRHRTAAAAIPIST